MEQTIFRTKFGSDLYGTRTPTSDTDYKSVHISDPKKILLGTFPGVISKSTGSDNTKNTADDIDDENFSLVKFFNMIKAGDMIAQELLHVPAKQLIIYDARWENIVANRHRLVDKNIKGFLGYIRRQTNKYGIKGSRVATARAGSEMFETIGRMQDSALKLKYVKGIRDILNKFISQHEHCQMVMLPATKNSEEMVEYFEILDRKISFNITVKEAYNMVNRIFVEYGARSLAAENNQGVDWKSVYHAVRVSEQAIELLQTGTIEFPRPNAPELLQIKHGEFTFEQIAERLEDNLNLVEQLTQTTNLRDKVDEEWIDATIAGIHFDVISDRYRRSTECLNSSPK